MRPIKLPASAAGTAVGMAAKTGWGATALAARRSRSRRSSSLLSRLWKSHASVSANPQ
jgi:hypothetical protein